MKLSVTKFIGSAVVVLGLLFAVTPVQAVQNVSVSIDGVAFQCVGSGSGIPNDPCATKIASFEKTLTTCASKTTDIGWCVRNIFPEFKNNEPTCASSAQGICVDICSGKTTDIGWCVRNCK